MATNYAKGVPIGDNQVPFFNSPPPVKAIATYLSENATSSSVVTVSQNTTAVEVATQGTSALIRWIATADGEASVFGNASIMNFDHFVPPNSIRRFVIPIESATNVTVGATATSVVGANREYGLFRRIAYKTQGVASIAVTEYGKSNSY